MLTITPYPIAMAALSKHYIQNMSFPRHSLVDTSILCLHEALESHCFDLQPFWVLVDQPKISLMASSTRRVPCLPYTYAEALDRRTHLDARSISLDTPET